ncbi:MAG: vWA domain-containing protein [Amaricoccus sp.]|uniref:vWA domain-containing protein n=1 Tax=Amaricoccus sp. TaxID=1872485 RepID=UPI0033148575
MTHAGSRRFAGPGFARLGFARLGLAAAVLAALAAGWPAAAQQRPMLMEGTETVYQRVLTRPGAPMSVTPDGPATKQYPAFQPLYVFAREDGWIEVGPSSAAAPEGWVPADRVVDWRQNIVAAFTNPAGRQRQALFGTEQALRALMEDEAVRETEARLIADADAGHSDPASGVVAVEPADFVNIRDHLYLMPILDFVEDMHPLNYEDTLLMRVASVPLEEQAPATTETTTAAGDDFDVGVVFVLDTTKSMGPYIDRTQRALSRIVDDISGTDVGARINFGVVAFRDSVEAVPGLDYRTKQLVDLERRDDQAPVLAAIREATSVATASSPGFNEDSLAGVEDAVDDSDWGLGGPDPYDGRFVILVTDAGPNDPRDPLSRSDIGPAEIQRDAEGKGIVVLTLHLETPAGGEANHAYAATQYRQLSRFGQNEFYYPIEGGSEDAFEATITHLVTALTDHIRAVRGEQTVLSPEETGQEMVNLGLAMRLAYLGERHGTEAPDVIEGWVSEKAVEDPMAVAIEPRLLVTKNELATMAELLEAVEGLGESARDEAEAASFFDQVRGVLARMAQNPDRLINPDANTLSGALEFLQNLPYRSQLLDMDEETWIVSATRRRPILDGIHQKLVQYRKWLYDASVWTPLYDGAPDGDHVFAMPFDVLP